MAYLSAVDVPLCETCKGRASEWLVNNVNARQGAYCNKHKAAALKSFQQREDAYYKSIARTPAPPDDTKADRAGSPQGGQG